MLNRNILFITESSLVTNFFRTTKQTPFFPPKFFWMFTLLFINLTFVSHSQKFLLTDINSTQFSIDKVGQQIYFKDFYTDSVRKIDLKTLEVTNTGFLVSLPVFSNIKHLMLFGDNSLYDHGNKNTFYLYDFNTHSKLILTDTVTYPDGVEHIYSFSPRDSNFYHIAGSYFSLKDSTLLPLAKNVKLNLSTMDVYPQWSSDSSLVFLSSTDVIVEYFLNSKKVDTLVNFANNANITSFAYNTKYNILAYSIYEIIPQIYFHYKNSNTDSLAFSPLRDDSSSPCWGSPIGFTSLTWSSDNKKLAFGVYHYTNSITGIYLYSLDSSRTYKATSCADNEVKTTFLWVNNDTIIYVNQTDKFLYGMDMSSVIISIDNKKDNKLQSDFVLIQNYPNPFNPSTQIQYALPSSSNVIVTVYNSLGQTVKVFNEGTKEAGNHNITFNGKGLSSGIYLYSVHSVSIDGKQNFTAAKKMLLLK